jgi:hypothetical protein
VTMTPCRGTCRPCETLLLLITVVAAVGS